MKGGTMKCFWSRFKQDVFTGKCSQHYSMRLWIHCMTRGNALTEKIPSYQHWWKDLNTFLNMRGMIKDGRWALAWACC